MHAMIHAVVMVSLLAACTRVPPGPGAPAPEPVAAPGVFAPTGHSAPPTENAKMETATFGAGCFWGVEATFRKVKGVRGTAVGYAGGHTQNPTYKDVCSDETGHAEVVQVQFDPAQVEYRKLVELFFRCHDPTQLNRQGPDIGSQYRSVIFVHSPEQRAAAEQTLASLRSSGRYTRPVVTTIEQAPAFYKAEDYHQQYLEKRGLESCHIPVDPDEAR